VAAGERRRVTGETMCTCGDYAGQHERERGEDGEEFGRCLALGGCSQEDDATEPCGEFEPDWEA